MFGHKWNGCICEKCRKVAHIPDENDICLHCGKHKIVTIISFICEHLYEEEGGGQRCDQAVANMGYWCGGDANKNCGLGNVASTVKWV